MNKSQQDRLIYINIYELIAKGIDKWVIYAIVSMSRTLEEVRVGIAVLLKGGGVMSVAHKGR